jgi:Tol biopolymer transport system component
MDCFIFPPDEKKNGGGKIMRSKRFTWVFLVLMLVLVFQGSMRQSAEQLYKAGSYAEEVEGDLQKAIQIYTQVLEKFSDKKEIAADAQLHIGLCYEKLGRTEAIKAYEQVLKNFAGQAKQVAAARERLAALKIEAPSEISSLKILEGPNASQASMISPDGTKVLFTRDDFKSQNVYVYDLSSKRLDNITQYTWENRDPGVSDARWSPDGKEIVFVRNFSPGGKAGPAEIAVTDLEGNMRVLYRVENTKEGFPVPIVWLPNSSAILTGVLSPDKSNILGFIPLSGGTFKELHTLNGKVGLSYQSVDVSPDERFVVFHDKNPQGKHDIFTIGTDGSSLQVLSDHPANEGSPRWSPDGKHIVFSSMRTGRRALWGIAVKEGKPASDPFFIKEGNFDFLNWTKHGLAYKSSILVQDVFTVSIDPNTLELIGKPQQIEYAPTGGNVCPSWSPDGKYLAFVSFDKLNGGSKIVVMSAEGGEPQEFPNAAKNDPPLAVHDLRWLPDSSGLGLSDYNREGKEQTLCQLDLKTGKWKEWPIPVERWTRTDWSKDGKSFLYWRRGFANGNYGIIERNPETGDERYVYRPTKRPGGVIRQLKFSRDYKKLVFTQGSGRIMLIDMESGENRILSSELSGGLAWSPDAKHLISTGERNKLGFPTAMFFLSVADGSAKKFDLGFPEGTTFFDPTWSPDGRQIAFMAQSQILELFLMKNVITK